MNTITKTGLIIPDADRILEKRCTDAAISIYGDPLPKQVGERLTKELSAIISNGYSSHYVFASIVADEAALRGHRIMTRAMLGSALVTRLLGISAVNPLPPHYSCWSCHHYEEADPQKYFHGYDLPDKCCPVCGAEMTADGADIPLEALMGKELDRDPDIVINLPESICEEMIGVLKARFNDFRFIRAGIRVIDKTGAEKVGVHPGGLIIVPKDFDISIYTDLRTDERFDTPVTAKDYHELRGVLTKYDLIAVAQLDFLHDLEKETCVNSNEIPLNDSGIVEVIRENGLRFIPHRYSYPRSDHIEREVFYCCKPNRFSDVIRILGLLSGVNTWIGNGEEFVRRGLPLQRLICCREQIFSDLVNSGVDSDTAWSIRENIRMGKGLTDAQRTAMEEKWIPSWYIDSCCRIKYLFPKAHLTEYAILYSKLAYYKLYYPGEYAQISARYMSDPLSATF